MNINTSLMDTVFEVTFLAPTAGGELIEQRSTVAMGPGVNGQPYNDFENIREAIAIRTGLNKTDILVTSLWLDLNRSTNPGVEITPSSNA